jgi:hypothetical protein
VPGAPPHQAEFLVVGEQRCRRAIRHVRERRVGKEDGCDLVEGVGSILPDEFLNQACIRGERSASVASVKSICCIPLKTRLSRTELLFSISRDSCTKHLLCSQRRLKKAAINLLLSNCTLARGKLEVEFRQPFDASGNIESRACFRVPQDPENARPYGLAPPATYV